MDIKRNISPTKSTTASPSFGYEAAQEPRENSDSTTKNAKSYFKPWRVFINHIDSYHGKLLADVLSDTAYVDPLSTRADATPNGKDEEFEDENDKYTEEEDDTDEEEEEEEEEEGEEEEGEKRKRPDESTGVSRKYEVIGTILDRRYRQCPEDVTVITRSSDDKDLFLSELMTCGAIIYDITQEPSQIEEACWVLKEIVRELEATEARTPKAFKRQEPMRHFILISTVMTWALTKPLDPADPDLPFTEADYRKRKPHPNYKEHIRCEREVVTVKKLANLRNNLRTLVICCGITYGGEEGPLHYLFKIAWQNAPFLPIFGRGRNKIPLLHVRDLAATVSLVLRNWPPIRYIVAVEQELISQNTIVKKISQGLTTGRIKSVAKQDALLLPEVSPETHDLMTVDLNIDPVYIVDRIRWHLGMPFRDSADAIIKEYKAARNLRPVKIVVLGPPAAGKTRVARSLADYYEIHYVHVKTLISDTIQRLIDDIEVTRSSEERGDDVRDTGEDDDEDKEDREEEAEEREEKVAKLREQLDEIRANMAANNGRLDDVALNKLFLDRLKSKECENQGYVMDGHPKTLEQARRLFLVSEEDLVGEEEMEGETRYEDEDEDAGIRNANIAILPELIVILEASDEFLKERIINRPEKEIQGTHYTEEGMLRRMREYREKNTDDNTPQQLFDEMEIHPLVISVETDACPDMFPTIYQCLEKLGKPRNYGPTEEEMEAIRKRTEAETRAAEAAEKLRREREILEHKREREEKMMEWTSLMEKLKQEEEERLCILAEPLRHYLAKHVFPTLTEALIEVARLRPDDPVDFLAEYLFKKNPEGKMFEPDYTETMSMLLDAIGKQRSDVLPGEGLEAEVAQLLKRQDELSTAGETSEEQDVCGEITASSSLKQNSEYDRADDSRTEGSNLTDRIIDELAAEYESSR